MNDNTPPAHPHPPHEMQLSTQMETLQKSIGSLSALLSADEQLRRQKAIERSLEGLRSLTMDNIQRMGAEAARVMSSMERQLSAVSRQCDRLTTSWWQMLGITTCATATILGTALLALTLLRPGWTMSAPQRRQMEHGQWVAKMRQAMTPEQRQAMDELMNRVYQQVTTRKRSRR